MPPGATATADDATGVVTVKSPVPDAFLVSDVGQAQIVCGNGMKDRSLLKEGADGTGLYTLTSAVPGSSYTLTLRKGYTWGAGGVTSDTAGAARHGHAQGRHQHDHRGERAARGPGQHRRGHRLGHAAARPACTQQSIDAPLGELWFNEKAGMPTANVAVRKALTEAVQLSQLGQVLTSGTGTPATGLVAPALSPCKGNTVGSNLPGYDLAAAKSALAGQNLSLNVYYPTSLGTGGERRRPAAPVHLVAAWREGHAARHHRPRA